MQKIRRTIRKNASLKTVAEHARRMANLAEADLAEARARWDNRTGIEAGLLHGLHIDAFTRWVALNEIADHLERLSA